MPEDKDFLGRPLRLMRATEPSNILWENRHVTFKQILCRSMGVGVVVIILLLGALALFTYMSLITVTNQIRYPPSVSCESIDNLFTGIDGESRYQQYAELDKTYTLAEQGTGIYQCYCAKTVGYVSLLSAGGDSLCSDYVDDEAGGYLLTEIITVLITVVNMIIRDVCIVLIKMIGFHTETVETAAIMTLITVATFFNTAILLLLTNANTKDTILSWIPLRGTYTDLNENWYLDVGTALVWTMLINSVYIYLGFVMQLTSKAVFRSLDQGCANYFCCRETKQTKKKTIQAYVNLYAGPPHLMHFKYATAMNTIYTTFMYGFALPILYPIAALTFINIYVVEKLCVAWWYQRPPVYDGKLNTAALGLMRWAPLPFFLFGYWVMGNKQIFNNTVVPLKYKGEAVPADHNGLPWDSDGPSIPLFFAFVLFIVAMALESCIKDCLKKYNMASKLDDMQVDENLGNYFETLPGGVRKSWFTTEVYNTNRLGIKMMGTGAFEQMRTI